MASFNVRETFFRPEAHSREAGVMPADLYNALQLILKGPGGCCVFVPLRNLQYQAVVEREEVIFVDSYGGYAHQDGQGGRLILIAWDLTPGAARESLSAPVPFEIICYQPGLKETQRRLIGEVHAALQQALQRHRDQTRTERRRVLPLRRGT